MILVHSQTRHRSRCSTAYINLRRVLKDHASPRQQEQLSTAERRLRGAFLRGSAVECPCCQQTFRAFLPAGEKRRRNARCPACGSLERHRLIWLYLQRHTTLFTERLQVLHLAPEKVFRSAFAQMPNLSYVTADLFDCSVTTRCDLQALPFHAASFDLILCSHVLEHVPDDHQAMRELRRVLRPSGVAILHVPIHPGLTTTYEDPSVTTATDRLRAFGQADHWRKYGVDYPERLIAAGFNVTPTHMAGELPEALVARYGLHANEVLYVCKR